MGDDNLRDLVVDDGVAVRACVKGSSCHVGNPKSTNVEEITNNMGKDRMLDKNGSQDITMDNNGSTILPKMELIRLVREFDATRKANHNLECSTINIIRHLVMDGSGEVMGQENDHMH